MSALSPSATWAITSSVAGLIVSNVRPLVEFTHLPSISIFVWVTFTWPAGGDFVAAAAPFPLAPLAAVAVGMAELLSVGVFPLPGRRQTASRGDEVRSGAGRGRRNS